MISQKAPFLVISLHEKSPNISKNLPKFGLNKEKIRENTDRQKHRIWTFFYTVHALPTTEVHSEPCHTSKMERFEKIVNS